MTDKTEKFVLISAKTLKSLGRDDYYDENLHLILNKKVVEQLKLEQLKQEKEW